MYKHKGPFLFLSGKVKRRCPERLVFVQPAQTQSFPEVNCCHATEVKIDQFQQTCGEGIIGVRHIDVVWLSSISCLGWDMAILKFLLSSIFIIDFSSEHVFLLLSLLLLLLLLIFIMMMVDGVPGSPRPCCQSPVHIQWDQHTPHTGCTYPNRATCR